MRVFPGQIQFGVNRTEDGRTMLQFRQVAPAVIQLATGPSWAWTPWQDILEVSSGDEHTEHEKLSV